MAGCNLSTGDEVALDPPFTQKQPYEKVVGRRQSVNQERRMAAAINNLKLLS